MSKSLERLAGNDVITIRRKILTLAGAKFHVFNASDQLLFFTKLKAFKLKEDIRIYADEAMSEELLVITARKVLDFASAYDVVDPTTGDRLGALRRKGLKSILRDEWLIFDVDDQEIAKIQEDSGGMALLRRFVGFVSLIFPQKYHVKYGNQTVVEMAQNYNPFVTKITVNFATDTQGLLDRRVGLAAAILLCAIEGKQS